MICKDNLWAPLVTAARKPWIVWTCVRSTRKDAKAAYLEDYPETSYKELLARVKFIRVFVTAHNIKE